MINFLNRTPKTARARLSERVASKADRAHASHLFLGTTAQASLKPGDKLSLVAFARSIFATDAFIRQADQGASLSEPLDGAAATWAARALPLTDQGRSGVKSATTRADALAHLFADPIFLSAVMRGQTVAFSPGAFLQGSPAPEEDRLFAQDLIDRGSALIDPRVTAQWGLDSFSDPVHLVRYGRLAWFRGTALFDADWYQRQRGVAFEGWLAALRDYVEVGEALGLSPNPFVNAQVFMEANADILVGVRSGAERCWLNHLVARDAVEQRSAACHFDATFYATQVSPKTWAPFGSPFAHYVALGWKDGLSPNACFDALWYMRTYPNVRDDLKAGRYPNAFSHFVMVGEAEGLRPSPFFDAELYARRSEDLGRDNAISLFRHFWSQGRFENRDVGDPAARAATRAFLKRLPAQSDLVTPQGLRSADLRPEALLRASEERVEPNLADLILADQATDPTYRTAVVQALSELGRPQVRIQHGAKQQVHAGDAIRLYVSGEALGALPLRAVRAASPHAGRCEHFTHISLSQIDVAARLGAGAGSLMSGFMAWFEFSARDLKPGPQRVNLEFVFEGSGGQDLIANETVTVEILARPRRSASEAAVQVAMASYNPPREPFREQVDSILANPGTHLVISDDASPARGALSLGQFAAEPRVDIDVNAVNTGFIINFERSLYMCSPAAKTILFSDQDDLWRSDKVETLVRALDEPEVVCAFSDMRITTDDGEVISPTFWNSRTVHHFDPLTVGVANTVTGAASAFPADLVELLAPFPRYTAGLYHDQWLSVLSAAVGRIGYVDRPLYDYIQHGGNVLGFSGSRLNDTFKWPSILRRLKRARRAGRASQNDVELIALALDQTVGVMQRFVMWHEALVRVPGWFNRNDQALAQWACAAIAGRPFDAVRLKAGSARLACRAGGQAGLLAIDALIEAHLLARHLVETGVVSASDLAIHQQNEKTATASFKTRASDPSRTDFERKVEGLAARAVVVDRSMGVRVNIFLPELRLNHFFGGYHSKISLITRLRERGVETRLVLVDEARVSNAAVSEIIGAFPELEKGLAESDIQAIGLRDEPFSVGSEDALMATTWWSARVVNGLRNQLGRERFLYFIQEYEPFTFSLGTWYRAAEQTYDMPHDAIFSTEALERFFREQGAGVFSSGQKDARFLTFQNPITGLKGVPRQNLVSGRRPRLLFYARPQATEARNMYEFGLAALRRAAAELGDALNGWDLVGVGSDRNVLLDIGSGRSLRLIKKLDSYSYREMLASSDVGLSLMYTPHPSLVPLEMAAAGMVTVTNACMSKTAAAFADVSPLIRVAEAEVEAIADELVAAVRQVMAGPVRNPGVDWPTSPAEAFPDAWLDQFMDLARRSLAPSVAPR